MQTMTFEEATGRHPRALKVAHDRGLSSGTENTIGDENIAEDEEIRHVEHGRAGRVKTHVERQTELCGILLNGGLD